VNATQRHRYAAERYVIPGLGGLLRRECTVSHLEALVLREMEIDERPASVGLVPSCLKGMLDVAMREDALTANLRTVGLTRAGRGRRRGEGCGCGRGGQVPRRTSDRQEGQVSGPR
jgi:hypothetical protein